MNSSPPRQAIGDPNDEQVADFVAQAVVDDFEAVEVDEEDGEFPLRIALGVFNEAAEPVVQ